MIMKKGKIVQISGPVIDVEFEDSDLPYIKDALEVDNDGKRCVMEVAQHIGNNTVRCIMLASSEGLHKDMEVTATGSGIKVPVGEKTLGRLFNVLGDTIDKGEDLKESIGVFTGMHRDLKSRVRQLKCWKRVLRSLIFLHRMLRVVRSDFLEVPVLVKRC